MDSTQNRCDILEIDKKRSTNDINYGKTDVA